MSQTKRVNKIRAGDTVDMPSVEHVADIPEQDDLRILILSASVQRDCGRAVWRRRGHNCDGQREVISSSSAFASFRSRVSNPSVNHP